MPQCLIKHFEIARFALALQHGNAHKANINGKVADMSILLYDPEEA
jgi:hypothetical protein